MAVEKIQGQLVIELEKNQAKKTQGELDVFARDTGKKLDKVRMNKLADDLANLQIKKKRLDAQFKQNEKLYAKGVIDKKKLIDSRKAINNISSEVTEARRRLQNFKNTGDPALSRLQKKFNDVGTSGRFVRNTIVSIGGAIASYISVRSVNNLSESFTNLQNRLKQVADEGPQLDELTRRIFDAANSSRTSVEAYATAFARFDMINKQIGGSQEETLTILDSLSKGLSATGAEASEVNSVMLQLSQAFGSGRLAGDEFRSVSENMPILLDILAEKLGVARGELKEMAADGLITSEVLKGGLIDANEQLNESFEKSSVTIGQAMTVATNKFIAKFGELDESYNITERLTSAIFRLSDGLIKLIDVILKYSWVISEATKGVAAFIGAKALYGLYTILPGITARMALLGATTVTTTGFVSALRLAYIGLLATLGPIGLAIAGLTALIYAGGKGYEYLTKKQEESETINYKLARAIKENEKAQVDLQKQMDKGNITNKEYFDELKKLETEHNTLTAGIEATKNKAWNYNDAINALANTKYEPGTDGYVREREEIINNINETIKLLEARKALGVIDLDKKTSEYEERQAKVSQTNTFTGPGSTNELSGIESQITAQLQEQTSISKEITKEKEKILNIDKAIADIRSGAKYQGTSGGITQTVRGNGGSGGSGVVESNDKEKEALKELEEMKEKEAQAEERRNDWKEKQIEDLEKAQKSYTETFEDSMKKSEENAENLRKKIKDVQSQIESLQDLEKEKGEVLSERALEIEEEINKAKEERRDADSVEKRELNEKIRALREEKRLIEENTTEAERAESKRVNALSETEKFLEDFAKKQEEIGGGKTQEELQLELANLQTQLSQEEQAYKNLAEAKELVEQNYAEKVKEIQESITSTQFIEDQKRIKSLERVRQKALETAKALRSAGQGTSKGSSGNTTNTVNNNPTVTVNANVNNNIDVDQLGNELADKVSLSSKGIY